MNAIPQDIRVRKKIVLIITPQSSSGYMSGF